MLKRINQDKLCLDYHNIFRAFELCKYNEMYY